MSMVKDISVFRHEVLNTNIEMDGFDALVFRASVASAMTVSYIVLIAVALKIIL